MRNTRSITMLAVAVLLAFGAVLVAARWINAQAAGTTTRIAIAQVDIGLGARISPEMVKLSDWPANAMPPGAVSDAARAGSRPANHCFAVVSTTTSGWNVTRGSPTPRMLFTHHVLATSTRSPVAGRSTGWTSPKRFGAPPLSSPTRR